MSETTQRRLRVEIRGAVQGVGFRPFVYRLATGMGLHGWVLNDSRGVFIEAEGDGARLEQFARRLADEQPPRAVIQTLETSWLEAAGFRAFVIRHSENQGAKTVVVLPDMASCADCLREVFDGNDRRHSYPFTNCTNCGPRFTIVRALPYDRPNTTMRGFRMCRRCQAEYDEPLDRRFHAQPNACRDCGPQVALRDAGGRSLAVADEALVQAAAAIGDGRILGLKGLGGFHLMVDARNDEAVTRLRQRKGRYEKPLALMVADLEQVRLLCRLTAEAEALLASPEAPIVLLPRRRGAPVARQVAPGNPWLGVMLPYTPLHHLLLQRLGFPIVATSGNLSDEPICTDNREAFARLAGIADLFLVHDRPIARHVDDSVVTLVGGGPQPVRRARGWAPLPVVASRVLPTILAVGAHLKNTVALGIRDQMFLSQHIGDMESPQALDAFERVIGDFLELYEARPEAVAHDLHPDYPSTLWVRELGAWPPGPGEPPPIAAWKAALAEVPAVAVQHHHAHLASCLADNGRESPTLGVTWDGTGYGPDGTVWGGEFLLGDSARCERVARLRSFRLPGGEAAIREPHRVALALLWELLGEEALEQEDLAPVSALSGSERRILPTLLTKGLQSPITTSAGRLFDAVASLLNLRQRVSFEGQAAMELEFLADPTVSDAYELPVGPAAPAASAAPAARRPPRDADRLLELDWRPVVEAIVADTRRAVEPAIIAARFHNSLVAAIVTVAREIGELRVALTGGCFQNRLLTERAAERLRRAGFEVLLHRRVPPNDGGISLGQVAVAAARLEEPEED